MEYRALLLTVLVSFFFLVGIFLPSFFKNKEKLVLFTTSFTLMVMFFLLFSDLLPEIVEIFEPIQFQTIVFIFLFVFLGFVILKLLDFLIPDHHHEHHEKNDNKLEHNAHLFHIGFLTSLSLIIHNSLEGISIYLTGLTNMKLGFLMAITVGCHNLPLGISIAVGLSAKRDNKLINFLILFSVILSSFLGAFLLFLFSKNLSLLCKGILLSMTTGMILYISLCELLPEIIANRKQKEIYLGLFFGILFVLFLFFL